jgi:hypothetical protein
MSVTKKIYSRLINEQQRSGLDMKQFVALLDAEAAKNNGSAYVFGAIVAEFSQLSNKETVCRIVRKFREENRTK